MGDFLLNVSSISVPDGCVLCVCVLFVLETGLAWGFLCLWGIIEIHLLFTIPSLSPPFHKAFSNSDIIFLLVDLLLISVFTEHFFHRFLKPTAMLVCSALPLIKIQTLVSFFFFLISSYLLFYCGFLSVSLILKYLENW